MENKENTPIVVTAALKIFSTIMGLIAWVLVYLALSFVLNLVLSVPLIRQIFFVQDAPFITLVISAGMATAAAAFVSERLCEWSKAVCIILAVLQGIACIFWIVLLFMTKFDWYTISMIAGWGCCSGLAIAFFRGKPGEK